MQISFMFAIVLMISAVSATSCSDYDEANDHYDFVNLIYYVVFDGAVTTAEMDLGEAEDEIADMQDRLDAITDDDCFDDYWYRSRIQSIFIDAAESEYDNAVSDLSAARSHENNAEWSLSIGLIDQDLELWQNACNDYDDAKEEITDTNHGQTRLDNAIEHMDEVDDLLNNPSSSADKWISEAEMCM